MAIQSIFNKIKTDSIMRLVSSQVVVKATLDTSSDQGVILGTSADARAIAIEPMQGEVQINGKVNFKTIFLSNENGVTSLDYFADFNDIVKDVNITASSKLMLKLNVIDTDSTVSGGDIILTAVVEIVIDEVKTEEVEVLSSIENSVFSKNDNIDTETFKVMAEGAFELFEEVEAAAEIDKVLVYDAQLALTSGKCGVNTIMLTGEAYAVISYRSGDAIMSKNVTIPFSEEMDAEGATPESMVIPELMIKNKRIVLSGGKGENIIRIEMVIAVKAPVFAMNSNKIISDIYSNTTNMEYEDQKVTANVMVMGSCFKEKISAVATLNAGMPNIKNILTICLARNNIANLIPGNNEIIAEGLMTACVLYLDDEGKPTAVRAELPYSLKMMAEGVMDGDMLTGYGSVYNVGAKANSVNEIEVKADIKICVTVNRKKSSKVISKIIEGEKKDIKQNAVSIYIASGGEEMWDIVKSLSTSPDDIMSQNADMKMPLAKGTKVRVYRSI